MGVHVRRNTQRHGIGQVLILLALWGNEIRTVPNAKQRADAIVEKLLLNADAKRWWSLSRSRDFRLLAEASPRAFLAAIEDSLDQNNPPIRVLFGSDGQGVFETEHLSDLLWALESLAWSPDHMPRVTHVLARLDAIDNSPGKYLNRPANSLREIHLLWGPQTYATLDQRLRALDLIRKEESDAAWKLMLGILPRGHDTSTPSPMPRWRDYSVDRVEAVTYALIGQGASAISERLLADVGVNVERWSQLINRISDLLPGPFALLETLEAAEEKITSQVDRTVLWKALRGVLHHHRAFPDSDWSMPPEVLDRMEVVYERLAPSDPLERIAWLFDSAVALPNPSAEGWAAMEREIDSSRCEAARALFSEGGVQSVLALARRVGTSGYIGKALYDCKLPEADINVLLEATLQSENNRERDVAHGLILSLYRDQQEPWAERLIAKAEDRAWGETALMTIMRALPAQQWTWDQVTRLGSAFETAYWRSIPVPWISEDGEASFAIRKFIDAGRARHALSLAGRDGKNHLPSDLLVEVLQKAVRQPFENGDDTNEATMFQHYVGEILQELDKREDVIQDTLIELEWAYLPVLEYSRRPAKEILIALSEKPELFIEVLKAAFKRSEDSGIEEPEPQDTQNAKRVGDQAYRLLELWNRLPGTRDDGGIDKMVLEEWIIKARSLAKEVGRAEIADRRIGHMLSASPVGQDGNWPAEAVRDVIDRFRSKIMIDGFWVGKANRRGVTTRSPSDGGNLERQEAAKHRQWAKAIVFENPHTAKALDALADSYEDSARYHDEDAERLDWDY